MERAGSVLSMSGCDGVRENRPNGESLECIVRIIHEQFCCKRGYATATGVLAAQSLNVLFQVRLGPSRLRWPVSSRVYTFSRRTVMNDPDWEVMR